VDSASQAEALYLRFAEVVFRRCFKLLRNEELADDATQEVFLRLVREIGSDRPPDYVLSWVYRTATNHCLDLISDAARRDSREGMLATWQLGETSPLNVWPDRQLAATVLARFDRRTQAIVIGVLVDGMTQEEVAHHLELSSKTVARRLDRFLADARKYIARSGA
jgi:RNA polymerase sigma-70 factor (ECF subfamily)